MRRQSGMMRSLAPLLVFSILASAAHAEDAKKEGTDDDEPVYALTDKVTPPRVIKQVNPQYSSGAHGIRLKGSVLIETVVGSRGTTRKTRVVRGLDKDVDEAAVAAVKQWIFEPARKDGKAVAVSVQIEIQFHTM